MKSTWLAVGVVVTIAFLQMKQAKPDEPGKAPAPAADPMHGNAPGEVRDNNGLNMKLVWCPPGFVTMENVEYNTEPAAEKEDKPNDDEVDSKDEPAPKPRQTERITPVKVFLTKGYWLGQYEVTQSEWKQVMSSEPWKGQDCTKEGDDFPAAYVSWDDAMQFCHKLTERERKAGRLPEGWEYTLPTEAQWERACRARTETKYSFGDNASGLGGYAWFRENAQDAGEEYAHRVGRKKPNQWGLYDMLGNVHEWCRDWYGNTLPGGRDPEVTEKGSYRVLRGGSWIGSASLCRSANRGGYSPGGWPVENPRQMRVWDCQKK